MSDESQKRILGIDGCPRAKAAVSEWAAEERIAVDDERETLRAALEAMVYQFAYWSEGVGGYSTGGLSALWQAFRALGWEDPHPAPEARCSVPGCTRRAICVWVPKTRSDGGGIRRVCGGCALAGKGR